MTSIMVLQFLMFLILKVRFNIATHRETKEERATYVEILPESFEESIEQRRHVKLSNDITSFISLSLGCRAKTKTL